MSKIEIEVPDGSSLDGFTIENSGWTYSVSRVVHGVQVWWMAAAHHRAGDCELLEAGPRPSLSAMMAEVGRCIERRQTARASVMASFDANGAPVEGGT